MIWRMCSGENDKEGKNEMVAAAVGAVVGTGGWGGQERLRAQRQTVREVLSD